MLQWGESEKIILKWPPKAKKRESKTQVRTLILLHYAYLHGWNIDLCWTINQLLSQEQKCQKGQ